MKGKSAAMQRLAEQIERMASADYPVLITGESGVGKELAAQEIHDTSRRAEGPFVAINCACIPDALAESELFGAARGAYTGALADRPGLFETAHRGTLFLDEIEALSLGVQERLLRVIESGAFRRLGEMTLRRSNVRIIAASNKPFAEMIAEGIFRSDLYFRLNVLAIHMPPLRVRVEDIEELSAEFLRRAVEETGRTVQRLTPQALKTLRSHSWPGNVRELENAIRRAVVCAESEELTSEDFGFLADSVPVEGSLMQFARSAVQARSGTLSEVARTLGVSRKTLWNWRKQWNSRALPA